MIRLYAVNILPLKDEKCFRMCYMRSSKERQEKADVLQMPSDKARCIAAGLLLEYAYKKFRIEKTKELARANSFAYAQNFAAFPERMPEIMEGMRGKPEFALPEGCDAECHFNLSHSGNYVICVIADVEVGADVQRRTRVRESVLQRFFSEEEKKCVEAGGEDDVLRERAFAKVWACKEAATKLTGRGIGQLLGERLPAEKEGGKANGDNYRIWHGMLDEDYAWAVVSYLEAAAKEPEVPEPVIVDGGELFYEGKL